MAAVESGYLKAELVSSLAERRRRMETGEDVVVGVNRFTETEPNPLTADIEGSILTVDPRVEAAAVAAVQAWRAGRDDAEVAASLAELTAVAGTDANLMPATLRCARAGVTTGEWAGALREVFGEYRAPTGVTATGGSGAVPTPPWSSCAAGSPRPAPSSAAGCGSWSASRAWTGTPTAPSRSRCGPATPASRWCTPASG